MKFIKKGLILSHEKNLNHSKMPFSKRLSHNYGRKLNTLLFNSNLLFVPSVKTNVGTRAFSVVAPTLCNSLPGSLKSVGNVATFRHKVKTQLFKLAYPP